MNDGRHKAAKNHQHDLYAHMFDSTNHWFCTIVAIRDQLFLISTPIMIYDRWSLGVIRCKPTKTPSLVLYIDYHVRVTYITVMVKLLIWFYQKTTRSEENKLQYMAENLLMCSL